MKISATQLRKMITEEVMKVITEADGRRASYEEAYNAYGAILDRYAFDLDVVDYDEIEREATQVLAPMGWTPEEVREATFGFDSEDNVAKMWK